MNYDVVLNLVDKTSSGLRNTEKNLEKVNRRAKLIKRSLIGVGAALGAVAIIGVKIKGTIDKMDALAKSARNVGTVTEEGFRSFQLQAKVMEENGIAAGDFQRAMENLQLRIIKGAEGGGRLGEVYAKLGDSILDANGKIMETPQLMDQVSKSIQDGTLDIADAAALLGEKVGPKIYQAFKLMEESGLSYEQAMESVAASTSLFTFGDAAKAELFNDSMARLSTTLVKVFDEAIVPMLPHLAEMAEWLAAKLPGAIDTVGEKFTALQEWFQNLSPEIKGAGAAIGTLVGWLIEHLPVAISAATTGLTTLIRWVTDLAVWTMDTADQMVMAWELIGLGLDNMLLWFKTTWDEIIAYLQAIPARMLEIGSNIIQGLQDGITAKAAALKESVTGIASDVGDWFRNPLGIFSPSKVFIGFGENIIQGLQIGIANEEQALAVQMMAIAEGTAQAGGTIGDSFADNLSAAFATGEANFESFKNTFLDSLADMVGKALANSDALGGIFGGMEAGGGTSGLATGIGSSIGEWFAGLFADGGHIGSGKVGIVGEAGPELVKGPANVYSNGDTMDLINNGGTNSRSEPVVVNFNINAVDTQTGTEFILKNKNAVVGIINQAFNQQGKRGLA